MISWPRIKGYFWTLVLLGTIYGSWYVLTHGVALGITPLPRATTSGAGRAGVHELTIPGKFIPENHREFGLPTVIEFWTLTSPECNELHKTYPAFLAARPDVVIKQVVIASSWKTATIKQRFDIDMAAVPYVMIYGTDGKLVAQDVGRKRAGTDFLKKWIAMETRKPKESKGR